jgi:hypothetical protein
MKLRLSLITCCALALFSCRDEFSLEGPYADIPLAYAYLNADDDRHFIRVQKAFLEAGGNAADVAGIADSLYYAADEATIILENVTTGQSTEMERVNGQDFGLNREDGIFAQSPNILYTVRDADLPLNGGNQIRLVIQRPGEPDAFASTVLLNNVTINRPGDAIRIDDYNRPVLFSWSAEDEAAIYDVTVLFNIRELFPSDPSRNRDRTLSWAIDPSFVPGGDQFSTTSVRFDINPENFFRFIGQNLEEVDGIVRRFTDLDVQISAAGQEVLDRRTLENANSGITSSQALPRYTNLSNGLGILTSNTTSLKEGILLDDGSQDSLRDGAYTRNLGFR